jgi:hypothetical protein
MRGGGPVRRAVATAAALVGILAAAAPAGAEIPKSLTDSCAGRDALDGNTQNGKRLPTPC